MKNKIYKYWRLINWDGNAALKLKCWRKSFGQGQVSIGDGDFLTIDYDHGHDSDNSLSSTRWRKNGIHQTVDDAKKMVDRNDGYFNHYDVDIL